MGRFIYQVLFLDVGQALPSELQQEAAATLAEFLNSMAEDGWQPLAIPQQFAVLAKYEPALGELEQTTPGAPPEAPKKQRGGRPKGSKNKPKVKIEPVPELPTP